MFLSIRNNKIKFKVWDTENENLTDFPPVIFLHDSFGCIELWRDFPETIVNSLNCRAIAYDRLGYGESDPFENNTRENNYMEIEADVLIEIMDHLNIDKAVLFGHSDGATISLTAGSKYPDRICGIISEAAHVFVETITISGISAAVEQFNKSDLKQKLTKYHGTKTDLVFKLWAETWLSENFRHWNILQLLPKIQCPVLIIQGENDEFGTLRQVYTIAETVKGKTTIFIIPNVGHSPHKEASKDIIEKVIDFLTEIKCK